MTQQPSKNLIDFLRCRRPDICTLCTYNVDNMNIVVSISDFRNNLSDYIDLIGAGEKDILVKDEKKNKVVGVFFVPKKEEFDWDEYVKFVKGLAGSGLLASKEDEMTRRKFRADINKRFRQALNR